MASTKTKKTTKSAPDDRFVAEAAGITVDGRYDKNGKFHPVNGKTAETKKRK